MTLTVRVNSGVSTGSVITNEATFTGAETTATPALWSTLVLYPVGTEGGGDACWAQPSPLHTCGIWGQPSIDRLHGRMDARLGEPIAVNVADVMTRTSITESPSDT